MRLEGNFADFESDDSKSKPRKEKSSIKSSTPVLDNFSRDLIQYAEEGKLDPVVGEKLK